MRFSIHSLYVSLDFRDCTAAKPSVSHEAFCGLQFVVALKLLMKKTLEKPFQIGKSLHLVLQQIMELK